MPYRRNKDTKIGMVLGTREVVMRAQRDGKPVDTKVIFDLAEAVEDSGLDSVWVGDSLVSKPRLEPVSTLAAIAARTSRIQIGTAVLLPSLRRIVPLAHSLATLDVISRGRLIVGAGVGGTFTPEQKQDFTAAGVNPGSRAGSFTEIVSSLKRLWKEDHVSFEGRYLRLEDVTLEPKPANPDGIPLVLATHYRTGIEAQVCRAAQYADGIISISDSPNEYAQMVAKVEELTVAKNRDPKTFQNFFYMTVNINVDAAVAEAEADNFLLDYYGVRHWGARWGPWGPATAVANRMAEYARLGADHLVVRFASWDQKSQWERFRDEVLPEFMALS